VSEILPTAQMLQRLAGTVGKCFKAAPARIQAPPARFSSKCSNSISKPFLTATHVARLSYKQQVSLLKSLTRRSYTQLAAEEPTLAAEIEEPVPMSDLEFVQAYQALKPEERHIYDQRKIYNREMSQFRKQGAYASAVEVYKEMIAENIPADHYTYTQILNLYASLKRPTSAEAVWQKMLKMVEEASRKEGWNISMAPRTVTLPTINAMIHVYAQSGDVTRAMALFRDIKEKYGLKPDGASLQPVLWLLSERGEIAAVERLYFDWRQENVDWVPSVRLYTMLIKMYGKAGQFHMISQIFEEMREKSVKLDPVSVSVILGTLIRSDEKITSDLIIKLQEMGALTQAFPVLATDLNTMSEAMTLLASMKASEVPPDIFIFNSLLPRVCKDYTEARSFVKMMEEEYGIMPNRATFDSLLMMAATPAERSKIGTVSALTKELTERGILPEESTYCILIRFYSQVGDKAKAEELVSMARTHNPKLSAKTYSAIIRMYSFGGPYDKLLNTLAEVQSLKIKLDPGTVDIMFKNMIRRGRLLDAANMLSHMLHHRERVQMVHLVALFEACLKRAKIDTGFGDADDSYMESFYDASASDLSSSSSSSNGQPPSSFSNHPSNFSKSSSGIAQRTPGHMVGDLHTILQLHQVMNDTPGALSRAPLEYFAHVLAASAHNGPNALCRVASQALRSHLSPEDKASVFVEFLKFLDRSSLTFADDIAAWKIKLEGDSRTNPLVQSQFSAFIKYVQNASKNPVAGSRINRPTL
jgi:pentatricopeptide repeat protein